VGSGIPGVQQAEGVNLGGGKKEDKSGITQVSQFEKKIKTGKGGKGILARSVNGSAAGKKTLLKKKKGQGPSLWEKKKVEEKVKH